MVVIKNGENVRQTKLNAGVFFVVSQIIYEQCRQGLKNCFSMCVFIVLTQVKSCETFYYNVLERELNRQT